MEVNLNEERKLVTIWLTNAEKDKPEIAERLEPLYKQFSEKKYTVCVFKSGNDDLLDNTSALLRYNRQKQAEREVQEEKEMSMEMTM